MSSIADHCQGCRTGPAESVLESGAISGNHFYVRVSWEGFFTHRFRPARWYTGLFFYRIQPIHYSNTPCICRIRATLVRLCWAAIRGEAFSADTARIVIQERATRIRFGSTFATCFRLSGSSGSEFSGRLVVFIPLFRLVYSLEQLVFYFGRMSASFGIGNRLYSCFITTSGIRTGFFYPAASPWILSGVGHSI